MTEMTSKPSILSNLALRTDYGGSKLPGRSPGGSWLRTLSQKTSPSFYRKGGG
jgi:hypothetical protein